MTINLTQAAEAMNKSRTLRVVGDHLERVGFFGRMKIGLQKGKSAKEIEKVAQFIQQSGSEEASQAFIARYKNKRGKVRKVVQNFEKNYVKEHSDTPYILPTNLENLKKWQRTGLSEKLFKEHPEIHEFLVESRLLSQIRVTRDDLKEIAGDPCLLVQGVYTPLSDLLERFEVINSPRYKEKFILEKETGNIFTYLDNGEGLQVHNPYVNALSPIARLSDDDYEATLEVAQKFIRPTEATTFSLSDSSLNEDRTFIIQVVSSYVAGNDNQFDKLIRRAKHPYLRLIAGEDNDRMGVKKGDVIEVGYNWKEQIKLPFETTEGRFRSPDRWEYLPAEERVVTNIAISEEEAEAFYQFTKKYHNQEVNLGQPIGFNLSKQNCSVFVKQALLAANIEAPTQVTLQELAHKVSPLWAQKCQRWASRTVSKARHGANKILGKLPGPIRTAIFKTDHLISVVSRKILRGLVALSLAPIRLLTGGAKGTSEGSAFVHEGEEPAMIEPPSKNPKNLTKLSSYTYHLPGILQKWQRDQPSTVVYKNPNKLSIVPTAEVKEEVLKS